MSRIPDISDHLPMLDGFCHPDWEAIRACFEAYLPESEWHEAYLAAARQWLGRVLGQLGGGYKLFETPNFLLVTTAEMPQAEKFGGFMERALRAILRNLEGAACDEGYGKHVVFLLETQADFLRYIAGFYPDGDYPAPGGLCIDDGYKHMVLLAPDPIHARRMCTHELTHVLLGHLPLPAWLNEALAMRMDEVVCEEGPAINDEDLLFGCRLADANTIQCFWNGSTWDWLEGFNESYALARSE